MLACGSGAPEAPASLERQAILKYAERARAVAAQGERARRAWDRLEESSTLEAFAEALEHAVRPALRAYVRALERIKPRTPGLKRIHGDLVLAYQRVEQRLGDLARRLRDPEEDPKAVAAELRDLLRQGQQAESIYRSDVRNYYRLHHVHLKDPRGDVPESSEPKGDAPRAAPDR